METFLRTSILLFLVTLVNHANSHGRLMEPPNRSSLWRFEEYESQNPPINYDDNQIFCGGFYVNYNYKN